MTAAGSSPRTRGTLERVGPLEQRHRIIPAHAGNASVPEGDGDTMEDHPRARGERCYGTGANGKSTGSSPRTRGTPHDDAHGGEGARIIPAHAGNARL